MGTLLNGLLRRGMSLTCATLLTLQPLLAAPPNKAAVEAGLRPRVSMSAMHELKFRESDKKAEYRGLTVQRIGLTGILVANVEPRVFVSCSDGADFPKHLVTNVTRECAEFTILSSVPIRVSVPYEPTALPEGISEREVRLFDLSRVASAGPMAPIEAHLDFDNKTTIATLSEVSGRFVNGVLKAGERPDRPPNSVSDDTLNALRQINPVAGRQIVPLPEPNNDGDLRLSYPIDFPGSRSNLKPSVSISYSAQSQGGNIAEGWRLNVPAISIETRWGVPVFDPNFETESYVFNGEQLVMETGEYVVDTPRAAQSTTIDDEDARLAAIHLATQPHRTTKLRPRVRGKAHFVLRRDEGLWRFVRHGDNPGSYWWEAWQENPSSETVKVSYFGRAPGRLDGDVWLKSIEPEGGPDPEHFSAVLRRDDALGAPVIRWALAREKDAFGNIVDYRWLATHAHEIPGLPDAPPRDRDLYLDRVVYSAHQDVEETILRCRENPGLGGCRQHQGLYEVGFTWSNRGEAYQRRPDGRNGGWVVPSRLLERIDYRFRRRTPGVDGGHARLILATEQPAGAPSTWQCSASFLAHIFETEPDPLFGGANRAPRWLSKATKLTPDPATGITVSEVDQALFPGPFSDCETFAFVADGSKQETRFGYRQPAKIADASQQPFAGAGNGIRADFNRPALSELSETAASLVGQLAGQGRGPFSANLLGATETEEVGGGGYFGISLAPQKAPGAGFQRNFSSRTAHNEATLLLDVDGDGVSDLLVRDRGRWTIYRGVLNERGELGFKEGAANVGSLPNDLPFGFRFQYEPVMQNSGSGFELAPWGTLGISSQQSASIQTHYLADMDGDGRLDVVAPGGVFYNNSNTGPAKGRVNMTPFTSYIRASGPVPAQRANATTATAVESLIPTDAVSISQLTQRAPRYDTVRMWRSPFRGVVAVRGEARFAGRDDALEKEGEPGTGKPHPDVRRDTPYRPRDGLIVAIERSREADGDTTSCDSHVVGPGVLTVPRIPEPDRPGIWRLAGSISVREGQSAQYFVTLSSERPGVPPPTSGRRVKFSLVNPPSGAVVAQSEFDDAVKTAVATWRGEPGSTLVFDESTGELTFKSESKMTPLIIDLPIRGNDKKDPVRRFGVELTAVADGSGIGGDAMLATRLFDERFSPAGVRCVDIANAPELAAAAASVFGSDVMLASVEPGDVLYFRTHSIDDGNGDAVRWNPSITYLSAYEHLFERPGYVPEKHWRKMLDFVAPPPGSEQASPTCPSTPQSLPGKCASAIEIIKTDSTMCTTEDRKAGLCDAASRSVIRYRLAAPEADAAIGSPLNPEPGDYPTLALSAGSLVISKAGRVQITGALAKRRTPGPLALELQLLRAPQSEKERPICDAHRPPENGRVMLKFRTLDGSQLQSMPTEEGVFRIDPEGLEGIDTVSPRGSLFVRPDQTICLFIRHLEPSDQPGSGQQDDHFWPYDSASVSVREDEPVTVNYENIVAASNAAEDGTIQPIHPVYGSPVVATLCAADGELGQVQVSPPTGIPIDDATKKNLKDAANANADKTKLECFALKPPQSRYAFFVTPTAVDGIFDSLALASRFALGPQAADGARSVVESPLREPGASSVEAPPVSSSDTPWSKSTTLTCPADQSDGGTFARRFQLDVRVSGEVPRIFSQGDVLLGQSVARLKTMFSVREGAGTSRPAPARLFTVQRQAADGTWNTIPIEPRHLGSPLLPDNERIVFEASDLGPRLAITQSFHVVGNATGTATLTKFVSDSGALRSEMLMSSAYIGVELCAGQIAQDRPEALSVTTAFDEDSWRSNIRASRLLGTAQCVDQGLTSTPFGNNVYVRRPEHICPIVDANLLGASFERHASVGQSTATQAVWVAETTPLSVMFSPRPMGETESASAPIPSGHLNPQDASIVANASPSSTSPRAMNAVAIQSIRRSHAVAALVEASGAKAGSDIRDPLAPASLETTSTYSVDDPSKLPTLISYRDLTSDTASSKTNDLNQAQDIIKGAVKAPNGCGASNSEVKRVIAKCREVEAQVNLIAQPRKAYAFQTDYRRSTYDDGRRNAAGPGGKIRSVDGGDGAVSGQIIPDGACIGAPLARRSADDDSVREGSPLAYLKAGQARKNPALRAIGAFDPELPRVCSLGPDPAMWVSGELASASRLGIKNIHEGERRERLRASAQAVGRGGSAAPAGAGLRGVPKVSTTSGYSRQVSLGASLSDSRSETSSTIDMIDLNGDGFPDLIANGAVTYSDPSGNVRCADSSPWKQATDVCAGGSVLPGNRPVRASSSQSSTVGIGIPFSFPDYSKIYAAAANFSRSSPSGISVNENGGGTAPNWGSVLSVERGNNNGQRQSDIMDVNGDGLPDLIACDGSCKVRFNLGYKFSPPVEWPGLDLARDQGLQAGLGISPSFSTADGSFAGGLAAGTNSAASLQLPMDVNGDGLLDIIQQAGSEIRVRLATGSGFSGWQRWGDLPRPIAQSETDRMGGGAAFTVPIWIPLTPLWAIISPFGSVGASLARSSTLFRDVDGDGFPDLVVGQGVSQRPGDWPTFGFDNKSAKVVPNGLAQHGLLEQVWISTNPHQSEAAKANYSFTYGRSAKTPDDPNHRFVLRTVTIRDGISADDDPRTVTRNERRTCYTYGEGYHDRFERRFLGYGRVHMTEGCSTPPQDIPIMTIAGSAEDNSIAGVRRVERTYSNRTIYESRLLLEEKVFDLAIPVAHGEARVPSRTVRNVPILVDTALSTHARIVCHGLRREVLQTEQLAIQSAGVGAPYVPAQAPSAFDPNAPTYCRDTFAGADDPDPTFDTAPRRLTPALVQTLRETRESNSGAEQVMRTAVRFEIDHFGRVVRACDLGEMEIADGVLKATRGAVCSALAYDGTVRPQFTHGATGGGTIVIDQKNLVREVVVAHLRPEEAGLTDAADDPARVDLAFANDNILGFGNAAAVNRIVRRRTTAYDPQTGATLKLCHFTRFERGANDPCASFEHFPRSISQLEQAATGGVSLRAYRFDRYGNIERYVGPMGTGRSFVAKRYEFDLYINLVENSEQTHFCIDKPVSTNSVRVPTDCLSGFSGLGELRSIATMIDYRHAAPTLSVDVNGQATHTVLDSNGRQVAVYGTWNSTGPT
jgi:hypothetical protein